MGETATPGAGQRMCPEALWWWWKAHSKHLQLSMLLRRPGVLVVHSPHRHLVDQLAYQPYGKAGAWEASWKIVIDRNVSLFHMDVASILQMVPKHIWGRRGKLSRKVLDAR